VAIGSAVVTVSTVAIAISLPETDSVSGGRIYVRNTHATEPVCLGGSGVTPANGFQLQPATAMTVEIVGGEQLFAVRPATTDVVVHVLRIGA
jgi:hypothetical protein